LVTLSRRLFLSNYFKKPNDKFHPKYFSKFQEIFGSQIAMRGWHKGLAEDPSACLETDQKKVLIGPLPGDQMSFRKYCPKYSPTHFLSNLILPKI
jgi:hypothetical protein